MGLPRVDVLVVGLGPAGAGAAASAAAAGLKVMGVDKRPRLGQPVQCAELIPLPMKRRAMGDGIAVQPIEGMDTVLPSGVVESSPLAGLMIDRSAFDRFMAAEAERAGAVLQAGAVLDCVDFDRQVACIRPNGASDIARRPVAYDLMVAADGPNSRVGVCMGLPPLPLVHTRQYAVRLPESYTRTDVWLSDAYPGGYAWLFPKGSLANVGVGVDRRFCPDPKPLLDALLNRLEVQGRVEGPVISRTGGPIPVGGLRSQLVHGAVLFAGDAAGFAHPITGAGIAAAVMSGERAGQAAAEFVGGARRALENFEEDLRDHFESALSRALRVRRYLDGQWGMLQASRDEVLRRGWIAFEEYFAA
jgi:digeranylgeranylglycerophospholipid reductase